MIVVIGAGVVGLASALAIARRGRPVCVIERRARPGLETSTHNSGVIHAGLYYPTGTLKARLCVQGRDRLYHFCIEHGVPHTKCGKLVVAQAGEEPALERVRLLSEANGVTIDYVDRAFVAAREPHVAAAAALWSPETGWLDAEAYVRALETQLTRHDGVILNGTSVVGIESRSGGAPTIVTPQERIDADAVVNAAGLHADEVSQLAGGEPFRIYPCRGEYAELAPRARHMLRGLVYPVPPESGHGLGVHLTRTLGGEVWIGPTIHYQDDRADYERDRLPLDAFLEPTRILLPAVTMDDLRLGPSGIRPKLHPQSERFADFLIRRDRVNPFVVHAAGIDSPGLTASLAIGEMVAAEVCQ
ncbi:MAG TPA: NAD(P)/FAD-dependent oxidoreductase [Vicinamibacterales bacterium]|nr:NAD(P)/FAD-dependent oxidoreductase [Vicinamibacterales bacterium]